MHELIKVSNQVIGQTQGQSVNARDLHAFLEVGKDFAPWIKYQIERVRLVENRDYKILPANVDPMRSPKLATSSPLRSERVDYVITLDSAKHIAMMAGTDRGFEVHKSPLTPIQ